MTGAAVVTPSVTVSPAKVLWWATGIPLVIAAVRYFMDFPAPR